MNDLSKIRELQLRYSCKRTEQRTSPSHRRSPEVFDPATPGPSTSHASIDDSIQSTVANRMGDNEKAKKRLKESDVSINQFLNNYTSEDNASFEELSELQHKREKIRNAWMYEAEKKHNEVMKAQEKQMIMVADEQLMIANAPRKDDEGAKPVGNWSYKARNTALFVPDEVPLTMNEHLQREKMNQMVINKEATRFHYETRSEPSKNSLAMAAMMQAANQAGKVDITGKEMGVVSKSTLGLVATPSPAPGVDQSPLMTWGEIEGTPFRLDASDLATGGSDHPPSFKIPAIPVREKLLHGMNDTIAKRYRERRKKALKQAEQNHVRSPRFGSIASAERLLSMSPAAHRLATKELGIRLGTDKALKASYERATTRTPDSVPRLSTTPSSTKILRSSPCIEKSKRPSTPLASSITDNLLNFGGLGNPSEGRPSAADFF